MKWFHHDTDMHRNRKVRKLIRTHGATGFAFWCLLLEKLYGHENGFQIPADELWFEDISEDLRLGDYRTPIRILDTLAELTLIDAQLWQEHVIYVPSISERGDQYIVKRTLETEKKRRYRAKRKQLSTVDKRGTEGQTCTLSTSDTDSNADPDPDHERQEELRSSLPEESGENSTKQNEVKPTKKKTADEIKLEWLQNFLIPFYPARLDEKTGKKTRAIGSIKKNPKRYFKHITVEAVEDGSLTNALRSLIAVNLHEYRQSHNGEDPPKLQPKDGGQWVWAFPFVLDPANWLDGPWMNEVQVENVATTSTLPEWLTSPDDRFLSWLCSTHLPQLPGYPNKDIAVSTAKHWLEVARQQPEHFGRATIAWEAFSGSGNGSKAPDSDRVKNWYEKEVWANSWQKFCEEATVIGVKIRPQPGVGAYFYYTLPGSDHEDRLGFSTNDRTCRVLLDAWKKKCSPEAATA